MTTNTPPQGESLVGPYPTEIPEGHHGDRKYPFEYPKPADRSFSELKKAPKDPFEYQKPNEDQTKRIQRVRASCQDMASILKNNIKPSRELSLALTKLEEVSMWANKGIVFEEES